MTIATWLAAAVDDARRRGFDDLVPLLDGLADTRRALAGATWLPRADGLTAAPVEAARTAAPATTTAAGPVSARHADPRLDTIVSLAARLRRGEVTSATLTSHTLETIHARNAELGAFITVLEERAIHAARRADEELAEGRDRGPLHGIPISLKDLIDVDGVVTTAGSRLRTEACATRHATIVERLIEAGAVIVGKCNLHEFAFGTTNEDSGYGPARHPRDPSRSPGGSSGGSAVAVASGMSVASIGTDTGGSIRIPSSICGLVGVKPAFGELPIDGVVPLSHTLDHVGPITRSTEDAWILTRLMRGDAVRCHDRLRAAELASVRLGALGGWFTEALAPGVRRAVETALRCLGERGTHIEPIHLPSDRDIAPVYLGIVFAEAAAYHAATLETSPDLYTPPVRLRLELARYLPAEDFRRALIGREHLRAEVDRALESRHALVLPTLPVTAFPLGAPMVDAGGVALPVRAATLRLTQLFDITGHPAVTLPCGVDEAGWPVGLQLVGRVGETDRLLAIARGVEACLEAEGLAPRD